MIQRCHRKKFPHNDLLIYQENQQRLEQLQPKITEMNELMSQMKGAEGVDPEELSQLQVELADFDSRLSTVTEQINDEEKRLDFCPLVLFT